MLKKEGKIIMAEITFEKALKELEVTVARLEKGDIALEEALELFEKGMKLSTLCSEHLDRAEKKIKTLTATSSGEPAFEDWDSSQPPF